MRATVGVLGTETDAEVVLSHAVTGAIELAVDGQTGTPAGERSVEVLLLVPTDDASTGPALESVRAHVEEAVGEFATRVTAVTEPVQLPAGDAAARAAALAERLPAATERVVLGPSLVALDPATVSVALADRGRTAVSVERARAGRRVARPPVATPVTVPRVVALFGLSFAFYLALGDPTSAFDLVTGAASAAVVTVVLSTVVFERAPSAASPVRLLRAAVFLPYLLWAVLRANLGMAAVVLDPRLPIEPRVVRVPAPGGRVSQALLANSITLTPGTLTVDVVDDELVVHTLTAGSRRDLEAGGLARAVSWVVGAGGADGAPPDGAGRGTERDRQ
jgi:multicomponent Na+:H+ antiporter subunit E